MCEMKKIASLSITLPCFVCFQNDEYLCSSYKLSTNDQYIGQY